MSWTNFIKIFNRAADDIYDLLRREYNEVVEDLKDKLSFSWKQKELKAEIKQIDDEISRLNKIKSFKEDELRLLDSALTSNERKERIKLTWINKSDVRNLRMSDLLVTRELVNNKVKINLDEFEKIRNKFTNMLELAVWSKEQRNILLQFYSLNWKSLWIDVPPDLDIKSIKIENWIINSGINLLK